MARHPELAFDQVMSQAHADFGALGFYPLLVSYEKNTRKKYMTIYSEARRKALTNLAYVVPAFVASFVVYKYYGWADVHAKWWGINLFSGAVFVAFVAAYIFQHVKFSITKRKNKVFETIMARDILFVIIASMPQVHDEPLGPRSVIVCGLLCAFTLFYLVIRTVALNATLRVGKKEVDMVYGYLENKKVAVG